jgi:hypothetical protein
LNKTLQDEPMDSSKSTSPKKMKIGSVELQQAIDQAANILKAAGAEAVYLFGSASGRASR